MDSESRNAPPRVLVVDDEVFIREAVEVFLSTEGFDVYTAESGEAALGVLEHAVIDLCLLDISMPGMDGITLLGEIKKIRPDIEAVMASGCGTMESAIQAMRMGAYDYITKPILNFEEELLKVVHKALERRRLLASNRRLASDVQEANRELKKANGELKRHLTSFELLSETSRLVGDLDSLDQVLDLAATALEYQLELHRGVLLIDHASEWSIARTMGFGPIAEGATLPSEALDRSAMDPRFLDETDRSTLAELSRSLGVAETALSDGVLIPMRARGETFAFLLVLEPGLDSADAAARVRFLSLVAAQIAAPLALFKDGIVQ